MSRANNKEKYKEYDHNYYIKHKRPKSKIGQAELKITDLEAKLAESEKLTERLQQIVDKLRDKEFAGKTLVEAVNAVYEPLYKNKYDEAEELKQQLAEKEEQVKLANELLIKLEKEYDEQLEKQAKIHYRHLKEKDQDKIDFAIEQLKKVKEKINYCPITDYDTNKHFVKMYQSDAIAVINNQIEELKKDMK